VSTSQPDAETIVAIEQLIARYGHVVDDGDLDALAEVFTTEDCAFDVSAFGQGVHRGLEAIRAIFALGSPPHPPAHLTTNVYVTSADGETHVRSKWLTISRSTGTVRSGDYDDVVVSTENGWRIQTRVVRIRFYSGDPVPIDEPAKA
jgi:3-phenylpropionate/cinnamic acid dioxygenase small subunit